MQTKTAAAMSVVSRVIAPSEREQCRRDAGASLDQDDRADEKRHGNGLGDVAGKREKKSRPRNRQRAPQRGIAARLNEAGCTPSDSADRHDAQERQRPQDSARVARGQEMREKWIDQAL